VALQLFQLILGRGALFRIVGERRAPYSDAQTAHVRQSRVEPGVERFKRRQVRHARCVPFSWSKACRFEVGPQRPSRRDEDIPHMRIAMNWHRGNGEGRKRVTQSIIRAQQERAIVVGELRQRSPIVEKTGAFLDSFGIGRENAGITDKRVLNAPQRICGACDRVPVLLICLSMRDMGP
jgi:hypothetical protein